MRGVPMTPLRTMVSETYSQIQQHRPRSTDGLAIQLRDEMQSFTVGTDTEGYDHHYWRPADAVVVYDETGVDHVEYLYGRLLAEWVVYVDEKRGWETPGQMANAGIAADKRRKETHDGR